MDLHHYLHMQLFRGEPPFAATATAPGYSILPPDLPIFHQACYHEAMG